MSEKYKPSEILYTMYEFFRDFDINDVKRHLINDNILISEEIDDILKEQDEFRIDKLFFMLVYKEKNIDNFMSAIKSEYNWIYNEWLKLRNSQNNFAIDCYNECIKNSELPKNRDTLIHRLKYLWPVQKGLKKLHCGEYLVLYGKPNYGKRWIACDAVINFEIARKMNYKIFWLNVQKCAGQPALILDKLIKLKIMIDDNTRNTPFQYENTTNNKIFHIKKELRKSFETEKLRDSLLVLSGVPDKEVLKAFDLNCKIMLTTKYIPIMDFVPKELQTEIKISDGLNNLEAEQLLSKFKRRPLREYEIYNITQINSLCNGHPFVVNLIIANLLQISPKGTIKQEKWDEWIKILTENRNIDQFQIHIKKSLDSLENDERELYESLVIFRDDVHIPLDVLKRYWNNDKEQDIIISFSKKALLEIDHLNDGTIVCSINYMFYNYLINDNNVKNKLILMHQQLVDSYKIKTVLNNRNDSRFDIDEHDRYFYRNIGYHIKQSQMYDLFSLLYLDLRFLENKLRLTRLPCTMSDLELYKEHIINNEPKNKEILADLQEFLPTIEETLFKSADVSLLQYALNFDGVLKIEACRQISKLSNQVWFFNLNHVDVHRQIVHLPKQPTIVRLCDPNTALVALSDYSIMYKDLSYSNTSISTCYEGHKYMIKDIIKLDNNHFLSLDVNGVVKIWSFPKHVSRLEFSETKFNRSCSEDHEHNKKHSIQEICFDDKKIISVNALRDIFEGIHLNLICFSVKGKVVGKNEIKIYQYINEPLPLKKSSSNIFTNLENVVIVMNLLKYRYFLLVNRDGQIHIICKQDYGNVALLSPFPKYDSKLINVHQCTRIDDNSQCNLFIFNDRIFQAQFKRTQNSKIIDLKIVEDFKLTDFNEIFCSKITHDLNCLILGTNKGCIIYDLKRNSETFRIHSSESIKSLDICYIEHDYHDHIMVTCIEKSHEIIYIYGLKAFASCDTMVDDEMGLCDKKFIEPTRLCGGNLFDVNYIIDRDEYILYALDSDNRIHIKICQNNFEKPIAITDSFTDKVIMISSYKSKIFLGCASGTIYSYNYDSKVIENIDNLKSPITILTCFDDNTLFYGNSTEYVMKNSYCKRHYEGCVLAGHFISSNILIVLHKEFQIIQYEINNDDIIILYNEIFLIDSDGIPLFNSFIFNDRFIIAHQREIIRIYQLEQNIISENYPVIIKTNCNMDIISLAINADKEFLAVGYKTGVIHIFTMSNKYCFAVLQPNGSPINKLIFSPWSISSSILVLMVLSEDIRFYDIKKLYDDNIDTFKRNSIRTSKRFPNTKRSSKSDNDLNNEMLQLTIGNSEKENGIDYGNNPWLNKVCSSKINYLLSSIKFIGNSASQVFVNKTFTKFLTIDDEGNVHYLKMLINECSSNEKSS